MKEPPVLSSFETIKMRAERAIYLDRHLDVGRRKDDVVQIDMTADKMRKRMRRMIGLRG